MRQSVSYKAALGDASDDIRRAKVHHNIGNSLLKSNKIQESIESYKTALKHNPDDADTKYNLSYALSLLNDQDQNKQQDKNQDNQNKNDQNQQNQDQNQDQDQQKNEQQQNQPQPKDQETQQDNLKQPQQQEAKISKEDAERILEALKKQ
jgi:Ca-activated chloride channel homolog